MPNNQINKGYDFSTGQLVTADNLDALAQEATLRRGAINEQPVQTDALASGDLILVDDVSDLSATTPKKATIQQIFDAGIPLKAATLTGVDSKVSISATDGTVVNGASYSYSTGNTVTVTSNAHGLVVGDFVEVTCTSTFGDAGSKFSGRFCVQTVATVNTFTYNVTGTVAASSGTATWKKSGTVSSATSLRVAENLEVVGDAEIKGTLNLSNTKSLIIPRGTSAQRPSNPAAGEIRYNTELARLENYNGTEWKEMGASPFEASGGNIVLAPSSTTTAAIFSSDGSVVTVTDGAGHSIPEGQFVEIVSSQTGYLKFEGIAYDITQFTFKIRLIGAGAVVNSISCTYRKSGNHKVHIFTSSGSFVVGPNDGYAEVLIVAGGAGGNPFLGFAGGAGGYAHVKNMPILKNQTLSVSIGSGGATSTAGGDSSFNGVIAYGGKTNGDSGGNNIGFSGITGAVLVPSNATDTNGHGNGVVGQRTRLRVGSSTNSIMGSGYLTNITNVQKYVCWGGYCLYFDYCGFIPPGVWQTDPRVGAADPLPNNGSGGCNAPNNGLGKPGSSGLVVIRYAYKLST